MSELFRANYGSNTEAHREGEGSLKLSIALVLAVVCSTAYTVSSAAENKAVAGQWYGLITDEQCGKGHEAKSSPDAKSCALKCLAKGAKLVLYESKDDKIFDLSNQHLAKVHAGEHVTVLGSLGKDGKTIAVSDIQPPNAGK